MGGEEKKEIAHNQKKKHENSIWVERIEIIACEVIRNGSGADRKQFDCFEF